MPPPTPEQARIIAHPLTPLLVVAGAGSGKTATMSQRVVHLVVRGEVRPDQVLGLTFTRRATAELDQRVVARLARLADDLLYLSVILTLSLRKPFNSVQSFSDSPGQPVIM